MIGAIGVIDRPNNRINSDWQLRCAPLPTGYAERCSIITMRLWSIHPKYLDPKGLVALWREGLLAQNVIEGKTKGYKKHPQLIRFKETVNPVGAIASYLRFVIIEADNRGYKFDRSKIRNKKFKGKISVTTGQLEYEFEHLLKKLRKRESSIYRRLSEIIEIEAHPLLIKVSGNIESWEVINRKHNITKALR